MIITVRNNTVIMLHDSQIRQKQQKKGWLCMQSDFIAVEYDQHLKILFIIFNMEIINIIINYW